MFDQSPTFHFESDIDTQEHVLLETRVVDLSTVTISQDEAGLLVVTRNGEVTADDDDDDDDDDEAPVSADLKYRLEPEGDLFRIVALRYIADYDVYAGDMGGLVSSSRNLAQLGNCWIGRDAKVLGEGRVRGDAKVAGVSTLDGRVEVYSSAVVQDSTLTGWVAVSDSAGVFDCTLTAGRNSNVAIYGTARLESSTVETAANWGSLHVSGCCVRGAHIRNQFELVSFYTGPRFGWLDVFRGVGGDQRFSIGCQNQGSADDIRRLGRDYGISDVERQMLEGFLQLAAAAKQGWEPDEAATKSDDIGSGGEQAAVATAAGVSPPVLSQYGEDLSRNTTF